MERNGDLGDRKKVFAESASTFTRSEEVRRGDILIIYIYI